MNNKAQEYYDKGLEKYNASNYNDAIKFFKKAIAEDSSHVDAHYYTGMSYDMIDDYDKARYYYEKALVLNPIYADVWNELGALYYKQDDHESAEENYKKCLENDNRFHYAYYNLGLIEHARGNIDAEVKLLKKCIELKPNYANALNALGIYHYDKNEYSEARKYYQKTLRAKSNHKYALYNLGLIAEVELDFVKARDYYKKALDVDPDYKVAMKNLKEMNDKLEEEGYEETIPSDDLPDDTDDKPKTKKTFLQKIGRNLNQQARDGKIPEIIGRDKEIINVLEILFKRFKNNPIIIGQAGVGKTAIVEGIARRIVEGNVPEFFKNKEIIELNIGFLIAGTKYRGEFETKMKKVIDEAKSNENLILFIDEIHNIMRAGAVEGGSLDVAEMLKPALARGEITCIGATTTDEYRKYIEKDAALERRFYPVKIDELPLDATKQILMKMKTKAKSYYKVEFSKENIEEIVELCDRHIKKRYFPDKAIDIFEKIGARQALRKKTTVTTRDIKEMISDTVGITFTEQNMGDISHLMNMETALKKKVFGQDEAITAISNIMRITKRRLDLNPDRPDGVFLFTGPTGVGKTYIAKCLAEYMFGDAKKLIRFDMSEFSESFSITKLTGAPPGYVGYDETPAITGAIEDNPSSILLLDEIEKAHPQVIKLFLQIFDEGKVTDSRGKKIYFSDVTIIMTSNAMIRAQKSMGFTETNNQLDTDAIVEQLSSTFPKEFLNRIDEIVVFNPLSRAHIERILTHNVFKNAQSRFKEEGIELRFDKSVVTRVIDEGYSPELGARNLHRAFDRLILAPLVKYIYEKNVKQAKLDVFYGADGLVVKE